MRFLCALVAQFVDQPDTTLKSATGSKIHHQRPQPTSFSHIGWSELLPTSYKVRETSLVSYEHNRKTKRCLAHLCLLPRSTCLSRGWTRFNVSSRFSHLGWTKPKRKKKGYGVPSWHYCFQATSGTSRCIKHNLNQLINLIQIVFDTPKGTSAFGETIITFYKST